MLKFDSHFPIGVLIDYGSHSRCTTAGSTSKRSPGTAFPGTYFYPSAFNHFNKIALVPFGNKLCFSVIQGNWKGKKSVVIRKDALKLFPIDK